MDPIVHSKPVIFKDDDKKETLPRKIWDWIEATRVYGKIYNFCCRLKRSCEYAKFGWHNYDFDAGYALQVLSFKLKRLQRVLTTGHLVQDKETLKSLQLTIRLLDKLIADDYRYFTGRHNLKWHGTEHPDVDFEDVDDGQGYSRMVFASDKLPAEQQPQEREERYAALVADEALKARDKRWAFSIIAKYYEYWWD